MIKRIVKEALATFENDQILELSEPELLSIMERKPEVQAYKVIPVLVNWARKNVLYEVKNAEAEKVQGEVQQEIPPVKEKDLNNANGISDTQSTEMLVEETVQYNCNIPSSGDTIVDSPALNEVIAKTSDEKGDTPEVQIEETIPLNEDYVKPLENLVKDVSWNQNDAEYYLKEVHQQKILSESAKNSAMAQMLKCFTDITPPVGATLQDTEMSEFSKGMRKATSQRRISKSGQKRVAGKSIDGDGDCEFVYEKASKSPRNVNARVKTEDVLFS